MSEESRPLPTAKPTDSPAPDTCDTTCCACIHAANEHILSEYYDLTPDARKALLKGITAILKEKGGFLCTPVDDTAACFVPRNRIGHRVAPDPCNPGQTRSESVTVTDARRGVERTYLPPVGDINSELTAFAGKIEERDLAVDLGWQGTYSLDSLCSRVYGGSSSASMQLAKATAKGSNRFYVPTLMGVFLGQRFKIDLLEDPLFTVSSLGLDSIGPFFETSEKAPRDIPQAAPVYNKHNVNVLSVSDTTSSDNQGATINLNRRAYGAGDVFLLAAVLEYQSNIFSGLGDEGGVGCAINLQHDIECFHGVVDTWTPNPGRQSELIYSATGDTPPLATRNTQKLGTSRPLINLKQSKGKRDGVANVLRRGVDPKDWLTGLPSPVHANGCILIRPATVPADWHKYVGSFIALAGLSSDAADASEYYRQGEDTPVGKVSGDVFRWWFITGVQVDGTGRAFVYVDRAIQRLDQVVTAGPQLFREDNYTEAAAQIDDRALRYIIAPGAWVSDVRDGVAGNVLGNEGAQPSDPRRIILAPGEPDLAPGDPITNPPGPDVLHPIAFRARQFHHFPSQAPGAAFLSENFGRVQVGSGLTITGSVSPEPGETVPDALRRVQKDQKPHYQTGVWILGTCETGIRIQGYTKRSALELWQSDGDQNIMWWNKDVTGTSTLRADRTSGDFVLATTLRDDGATLTGPDGLTLTGLHGLSGTPERSHNLRGHQAVVTGKTSASVVFPTKEPDEKYHVFLQCTWLAQSAVVTRSKRGFEASFSVPAPKGAGFDWLLVR